MTEKAVPKVIAKEMEPLKTEDSISFPLESNIGRNFREKLIIMTQ